MKEHLDQDTHLGASSGDFEAIGERLRAHRMGRRLTADQVADKLGISRAAVYRLERGEIVKIETLAAVARLLDCSLASLLGVGIEYFDSAIAYFERMRQLEERSDQILANFEPVSLLLTTDEYLVDLRRMLIEAITPDNEMNRAVAEVDQLLKILDERKRVATKRSLSVVSVASTQEIERFLWAGLVGKFGFDRETLIARRRAAAREVLHIASLFEREPLGIQLGLLDRVVLPNQTFQIFKSRQQALLAISPFRLGEHPNIRYGVGTITGAPEAVKLFGRQFDRAWELALRGHAAAEKLRSLVRTVLASPLLGAVA
jgi:transcriptional regulator with XRE-family HTH domain